MAKGVITVRDLRMGREIAGEFADKKEWQKTSQFEVKRESLVDKVRKIIDHHR